jgi:hypothetical protein
MPACSPCPVNVRLMLTYRWRQRDRSVVIHATRQQTFRGSYTRSAGICAHSYLGGHSTVAPLP